MNNGIDGNIIWVRLSGIIKRRAVKIKDCGRNFMQKFSLRHKYNPSLYISIWNPKKANNILILPDKFVAYTCVCFIAYVIQMHIDVNATQI